MYSEWILALIALVLSRHENHNFLEAVDHSHMSDADRGWVFGPKVRNTTWGLGRALV